MKTISNITKEYSSKLDYLDLELLIAHTLGKPREFVLTHPQQTLTKRQETIIEKNLKRRMRGEPVAYIVGHKEFYSLDFAVNNHTLVPRPETELLVDLAISELKIESQITFIDIGTGSGNIIVSLAHELEKTKSCQPSATSYCAIDISKEALKIAKKNARTHNVDKKIKFLNGDLLQPILKAKKLKTEKLIVLANLPYLSKEIYQSTPRDVKNFEPKSALYSPRAGLAHYKKLLKQVCEISKSYELKTVSCILEISPEQKQPLTEMVKKIFPKAKTTFYKDLAGKWRVCKIEMI